jgi:hypothetical protein
MTLTKNNFMENYRTINICNSGKEEKNCTELAISYGNPLDS